MSTRHRRYRAQAAKQVFLLIDKDNSGTLDKGEIIKAVKEDEKVKSFLATCGEPNLEFLTQPARLHKALEVLDTSKDGEVDMEEWEEAINRGLAKRLAQLAAERERRERAAEKADAEFSVEFLNAARKCFEMIDVDESGTLEKAEMSAHRVRPSTRARRGSYAIDATRRLPPDPPAASRPSRRTKK